MLFTVDEVQYVSREHLGALIMGLHQISQKQLPLMLAGAGLPSLPALAGEAKSYAERLFRFLAIGNLAEDEAGAALATPAEAEHVMWQPDALSLVIKKTEGYPYFLQEFGKQTWDVARGEDVIFRPMSRPPLRSPSVNLIPASSGSVSTGRRTLNAPIWGRWPPLAKGPVPPGKWPPVWERQPAQAGPTRDALIKRGLCYSPRYGVIAFTVPLFDQFVRRWLGEFSS